ncbi:MAG: 2Fe-2S iron-sulfur cluster-binding protein [Pseudomonadota bacterium]
MVSLIIDGQEIQAKDGMSILETALEAGIHIPHLCFNKDLEIYGGCRLCMVEVTENGLTRLQPSCAFPVKKNIVVKTKTDRVHRGRKLIAELLLARCPDVDFVQTLAASFGLEKTRFSKGNSDCILCGQCVRVCRGVVKAQAIDFTGRGRDRYPKTPFDMPSEDCVGCGSCTYVCPTGAMKMEYENVLRWRRLPGPLRKCRYMRMGFIPHKVCPNNYVCWNCEVDQKMEDLAATHPVFMLKQTREAEREKIAQFELRFDRMYNEGHIWAKKINGYFRLGIDDFTRQLLGRIEEIKMPEPNALIRSGEPIWIITGNGKTLHMYTLFEGKLIHINPDIQDRPSLIGTDPYDRGWILTFEPTDLLHTAKGLRKGRSAKEWLKNVADRLHALIEGNTNLNLSPQRPIPRDFAALLDRDVWRKIDQDFFEPKGA